MCCTSHVSTCSCLAGKKKGRYTCDMMMVERKVCGKCRHKRFAD